MRTLPDREDSIEDFQRPRPLLPFALFTLVHLSPAELDDLIDAVQPRGFPGAEQSQDRVQLARPRHDFAEEDLREVYDSQLRYVVQTPARQHAVSVEISKGEGMKRAARQFDK